MSSILICPICSETLVLKDQSYSCLNNHNFDLSTEGYLNLLLVNQKASKAPGDNKEMVDARRVFLEQGFYSVLSDAINHKAGELLSKSVKVSDCGCGEGYYLSKLNNYLKAKGIKVESYGLDLSKYAIQKAAKKYKDICFIVSNLVYKLPLKSNSLDLILNIFAPRNPKEFNRVLKDQGLLIVVFPDNNHLQALREKLGVNLNYEDKPEEVINAFSDTFELVSTEKVEGKLSLDKNNTVLLTRMTPLYWQTDHQKIDLLEEITTDISFNIYTFRKL